MTADALREPWTSIARQREAAVFAMWVFLATEVLFFGGLFAAYAVYRLLYSPGFLDGARQTNIVYGGVNTFVLLTSSFAMAMGAATARLGMDRLARACFVATALLGTIFLVLKGFEYREDIARHLVPGPRFPLFTPGAENFWTLYWTMTLLHAVHLIIAIAAALRLALAGGNRVWLEQSANVEATALYWHFVDLIWVFLFPLLYLAGRS